MVAGLGVMPSSPEKRAAGNVELTRIVGPGSVFPRSFLTSPTRLTMVSSGWVGSEEAPGWGSH